MCQSSDQDPVWRPLLVLDWQSLRTALGGVSHERRTWRIPSHTRTAQDHCAWVSDMLLLILSTHHQRTHQHAFHLSGIPHRECAPCRPLAAAVQGESARSDRDVLGAGFAFTHEAVRDWEACFAPVLATLAIRVNLPHWSGLYWLHWLSIQNMVSLPKGHE
jgi:hypothetical protein